MNILFITADQWRGECLSALNHPNIKTPNLDKLAEQGVLFKKHYAQATPCSPSRTSIHSGMYLHNHRVCSNGTPFDARHTNWALECRKAGYTPYLFGYTDTARDPRGMDHRDPRLRHYSEPIAGIDADTTYVGDMPQNWAQYLLAKGYELPKEQYDFYYEKKPGMEWENGGTAPLPMKVAAEDHETHFVIDNCIDWLDKQDKPWITHVSLFRPHPPFIAPYPYNEKYDPEILQDCHRQSTLEEEAEQHPWLSYQLSKERFQAPENPKSLKRIKASYFGLMAEVDYELGRLFDKLEETGQWQETLIIFTSDHGEQMGDHWLMSKTGYFDSSYHIPLIIRDPRECANSSRGLQVDEFTENVDIMPTMLEWLGLEIPSQCDGMSLTSFLNSSKTPINWRREVHWEFDFREIIDPLIEKALGITQHQCALSVIRDDHYKYVHFTALPPLFFDLQKDPNEFNNLADHPDYQGLILKYAQKLISWRMNHDERILTQTWLSENGPVVRKSPLI